MRLVGEVDMVREEQVSYLVCNLFPWCFEALGKASLIGCPTQGRKVVRKTRSDKKQENPAYTGGKWCVVRRNVRCDQLQR